MKLKCLIVDDEPIACKGIQEYVKEIPFLELVDSCGSAMAAMEVLQQKTVDLILLDIQMPRLSGIDFVRALKNPPMVIFTTAYSHYALESYSLNVLDYLLKPIKFERFLQATTKAHDFYQLTHPTSQKDETYFFIKVNQQFEKIIYTDILYVEAMQNYCIIHTTGRKLICYITLSRMLEQLSAENFLKVHKSFIVSLDKVSGIAGHELQLGTSRIPISRSLRDQVTEKLLGRNLLSRS